MRLAVCRQIESLVSQVRALVRLQACVAAGLLVVATTCGCQTAVAQGPNVAASSDLPAISPGTVVKDSAAERWNRVVLTSQPSLTAGDVEVVPSSIRESAEELWLTIMATVLETSNEGGERRFRLKEVGVGTSVQVKDELRIVTLDNAQQLGINLGLVKRQQLLENQRQFRELRWIAQTTTLVIFDAPAIVHRGGLHVDRVMRHLIWIDARSGAQAMLVWFLEERDGKLVASDEPARLVPAAASEQRVVRIDRQEFSLLGIPSNRAFALESLPPGREVEWMPMTRSLAALPQYTMEQLRDLSNGLNESLAKKKP